MPVRTKLNSAAVHGAIVIAALVGWAFGSWTVFLITAAVLIATAIHAGDIRMGPRRR